MRPAIARIADPDRNKVFAIIAFTVSIFAFSYGFHLGPAWTWAFLAVWLLPVAVHQKAFRVAIADLIVFSLPLIAIFSTFWSAHPDVTLRGGLQFLLTVLCASIASGIITPANFASGAMVGSLVTVVYSLLFGLYIQPEEGRFAGYFNSPNQLGLVASIAMLCGVVTLLSYRQSRRWAVLVLSAEVICGVTLYWTESVTSMVSLAIAAPVALLIRYVKSLSPSYRRMLMPWLAGAAAAGLALGATFLPTINVFELVGREETISGRTELWKVGADVMARSPVLGAGYQGFWAAGTPEAERLWDAFVIPDKTGFHFHNLFVQVFVDLGVLGFAMLMITLLILLYRITVPLFAHRVGCRSVIYIPIVIFFLIRTTSEVDFFNQFTVGAFLMYFVAFQSARPLARLTSSSRNVGHVFARDPLARPLLARWPHFLGNRIK